MATIGASAAPCSDEKTANRAQRRICFVTGTRAEFGLMQTTLAAIAAHPDLHLSIIATGMHLDPAHGDGLRGIKAAGWKVDAVVPWAAGDGELGRVTGLAMAEFPTFYKRLHADIVLVVGDRVEAFAAAAAAHLSGLAVAHVHGGDRALGQVDDALRHAITKLAHVHFPATAASARRLRRLGEDPWRIHDVGSPGVDAIIATAAAPRIMHRRFPALKGHQFALLVLHPTDADEQLERDRAELLLRCAFRAGVGRVVIIDPNNDPGCGGIMEAWRRTRDPRALRVADLPRDLFLGLMRDAAMMLGNSSSGIIEAGSFATPVVDVGPRQTGRQRGGRVITVAWNEPRIMGALRKAMQGDARCAEKPAKNGRGAAAYRAANIYGGPGAGRRIAAALASVPLDERLMRKLIAY